MDELLGISLLSIHLNELPTDIIRIHPDEASLMLKKETIEEDIYFIDCGLDYNVEKKIFDHHQSKDLMCSAALIFNEFFPHLKDSKLSNYINLVSLVDTKGPNALDDYKFKSDTVDYFSFPQGVMLREFENNPLLITKIFSDGLLSMIEFENKKRLALEWINSEGSIKFSNINGINILEYLKVPPYELSSAVKSADADIVDEKNIHVIYSFDKDNPEVRTLFRTLKADSILDFTKSMVDYSLFCHRGGFLLKFIPKDNNEWKNIIRESIL